jgi:biopolymer transport protein ExbD
MGKTKIEDAEDLNLLPIMNLMTILIPMVLMSAQFVSLAVIDSTLPAISSGSAAAADAEEPAEQPLMLTVLIGGDGFTLAGNDTDLIPPADGSGAAAANKIPCTEGACSTPDAYDYKALTSKLGAVKGRHPKEENVILAPSPRVPYEVLVRVMDATREDTVKRTASGSATPLFPYVVIAGGAE